ncbi:MAG: hypothetical protein LKF82_13470 [Acinetobacter populi]|jgi:antitoxin (DNA-binding transcriptional repressor) of toxin-antitoxin stability system|uniref:type II toxin-antitoxin system Phd/YefM family antitoxin n=1 Tax=Acinetobacter populi TaxID=1582270 RepID=UPI002355CC16|nr:hypothetical protein [Acinetobacter populi]MCH4248817.1 hypothetical protein [Acinetobacter populi]
MKIIDIYEATVRLSELLDQNQPFIIVKEGKLVAQVLPYSQKKSQRIGFMPINIPQDFDNMHQDEILALFDEKDK